MNIKELTYSRTAKVNTGNYENRDITVGVVVTPSKDEDIDELMNVAREWVNDRMKHEVAALKSN